MMHNVGTSKQIILAGLIVCFALANSGFSSDPERGYQLLLEKPYLTTDFSDQDFQNVWSIWPEPLRSQAEQAAPDERRRMAFARYGLTARPNNSSNAESDTFIKPLQYTVSSTGNWTMNCFACHGGQLLGKTVPGLPNSNIALQTLSEEMREYKTGHTPPIPLTRMEKASPFFPLGTTRGTTNAVMFGVGLMALRDADLNLRPPGFVPRMIHHDMDAPPWWHYRKKTHLYAEGYAQRNHRSLMQFALIRSNGPEKFREWEADFQEIGAYLESIEPPPYPFPVDQKLAEEGKLVFQKHCAECHGSYGADGSYPNRVVALRELKTDPVRFEALTTADRAAYGQSWFADYGNHHTIAERDGYVAPPLDGIWASAPYLHTGAVPTLWHVLHPQERPAVWRRTDPQGYDQQRLGLSIEELKRIPKDVTLPRDRREYFDTRQFGKSAAGHDFPDALTEQEKEAVLEYLKKL